MRLRGGLGLVALAALVSCTLRDLGEYVDGEPTTSTGAAASGGGGATSSGTGGVPTGGFSVTGGGSPTGGTGGGDAGCPVVPCQANATCEEVGGAFQCVCATGLVGVLDAGEPYCAMPYESVSVGIDHACALTTDGHAQCWGRNWGAALGMLDNTTTVDDDFALLPRPLGAYVFDSISAGRQFTCGVTPDSEPDSNVACWGRNSSGQLGRGDTTTGALPQHVIASTEGTVVQFKSVHAAYQTVCGISVDDDLYCWGDNSQKQVSASAATAISTPTRVEFGAPAMTPLASKVSAVSMSYLHICVIERDSSDIYCWGYNASSQVKVSGTNSFAPNAAERRLAPLQSVWSGVAAGADFSCGLATSIGVPGDGGQYVCWGNSKSVASVAAAGAVMDAADVGVTRSHWHDLCHLGQDDLLQCKGTSGLGQLGSNSELLQYDDTHSTDPSGTTFAEAFSDVSVGQRASCGVGIDTAVRCWGARATGALGRSGVSPLVPEEVVSPVAGSQWTSVDVSPLHACGLVNTEPGGDGELYCWGLNGDGQLGTGDRVSRTTPAKVTVQAEPSGLWAEVIAGAAHTCAIPTARDSIYCWGLNSSMQVGPTIGAYDTPVLVSIPESGGSYSDLAAGDLFTCVRHELAGNEKVYCWGRLPGTTVGSSPQPTVLPVGFGPIAELQGAGGHLCAMHGSGLLSCWGENANGELGNDSVVPSVTPVTLGLANVSSVNVGANHTCAVSGDPAVGRCWGANSNLQVASTGAGYLVPTQLSPSAYAAVFPINTGTTFGLTSTGELYGWGNSLYEELFIGNLTANSGNHVPLTIPPLGGRTFTRLSGGDDGVCALTTDGKLFCWGIEMAGLRGNESTARATPRVIGLPTP